MNWPLIDDKDYPRMVAVALASGHITEAEAKQQFAVHKLVALTPRHVIASEERSD